MREKGRALRRACAFAARDFTPSTKTSALALFSAALRGPIFGRALNLAAVKNPRAAKSARKFRPRDRRFRASQRRPRTASRDRIFLGDE